MNGKKAKKFRREVREYSRSLFDKFFHYVQTKMKFFGRLKLAFQIVFKAKGKKK